MQPGYHLCGTVRISRKAGSGRSVRRGERRSPSGGAGYDGHGGSVSQLDIPGAPRTSEGRTCARRYLGARGSRKKRAADRSRSDRQAALRRMTETGLAWYRPETLCLCWSVGSRTAQHRCLPAPQIHSASRIRPLTRLEPNATSTQQANAPLTRTQRLRDR